MKNKIITHSISVISLAILATIISVITAQYYCTVKSSKQDLILNSHREKDIIETFLESYQNQDKVIETWGKGLSSDGSIIINIGKKEENKIIYFYDDDGLQTEISLPSRFAVPMQLALSSKQGTIVDKDYKNRRVIAAYVQLKNGWGLVVKKRMSDILQPIYTGIFLAILVGGVFIVMGVMAELVLNNRLLQEIYSKHEENSKLIKSLESANSELELTNIQLKNSNSSLEQFAYTVSHDLKAPLRAISNISTWLSEDIPQESLTNSSKKHLSLLYQRCNRMDMLIDGILQFSRIGRTEVDRVKVDLNSIVHQITNEYDKVDFHVDPLPTLQVNPIRFEQIFSNLIDNAIKHNDKEKKIVKITYKKELEKHLFCVIDNGEGIEKEYYEKIFEMFQTLHPRDVRESTGIGLALVKKIIEEYGGTIWVESTKGKGSEFRFDLPSNL